MESISLRIRQAIAVGPINLFASRFTGLSSFFFLFFFVFDFFDFFLRQNSSFQSEKIMAEKMN